MSSLEVSERQDPIHFSQHYLPSLKESDLDFFDVNLEYDSKLFIDPFLIKRSSIQEEVYLFKKFGDFFSYAYDKSLSLKTSKDYDDFKDFLNFHEPKEICLGYTESSHSGSGLGSSFASLFSEFFVNNTARRLIKEEDLFPDKQFNPITFGIFIDGLGPDGLSDLTANLIMTYLIKYTQDQCKKLNIPIVSLPVQQDGFDFDEMEWIGGGYYDLPENPLHEGQAIVLVPKRFLRAFEDVDNNIGSKVKRILNTDPQLSERFSSFVSKKIEDITIEEVRGVFLEEGSVFKSYLNVLTQEIISPYNFESDFLRILAIKNYGSFFADKKKELEIETCEDLLNVTMEFVDVVKDHFSRMDGWKDMWYTDSKGNEVPQIEAVFGRIFRGMGLAFYRSYPKVTFVPEMGTGNGSLDFGVIHGECRVAIELKKLENASPKGVPPLKSYLHGLQRQLPDYVHNIKATSAIYITAQHFTRANRPKNHHDDRVSELQAMVLEIEKELQTNEKNFKTLNYVNILTTPRRTASDI